MSKEVKSLWIKRRWIATSILMDAFLTNLGMVLAFLLRFGGHLPPFNFQAYTNLAVFITIVQLFCLYVYDLYEIERPQENWEIFTSVVKAVSLSTLFTVFLTFFFRFLSFPRTVFVLSWLILVTFLTLWRVIFIKIFPFEYPLQRILIVGTGKPALEVAKEIEKRRNWGYELVGLISPRPLSISKRKKGYPILGSLRSLVRIVKEKAVDRVIVASPVKHRDLLEKLAESSEMDVKVDVIPELYEIFIGRIDHGLIGDIPLVELTRKPIPDWLSLSKRAFDIFFSLFLLILLSPFMFLIALLIKLTSKGPVIYKQERVGQGEKNFWLYKFRTMIEDAEKETGPVLATEDDPRITPIGKFLRRYRLDELPQLVNILKGEMSFVGPRPERPYFVKQFKESIPGYAERFKVKPGVTGLAQVTAGYATTPRNKLKYDLIYIYNQSLFLDLKILAKTIKVVLAGKGAR
jgi:exopolysaccharide biosynthesis polyprenyl glycosylphosphotransferase